jgi:nicotinamide-nucleotide amidase
MLVIFDENLLSNAKLFLQYCGNKQIKFVTAESCTGGLLSALITEIPGSSKIFERGFVTYSNEAKNELLDVNKLALDRYGAVSQEIAIDMARGAIKNSKANFAVAITGVAGPDGGSKTKPVGLVFIALKYIDYEIVTKNLFSGSRNEIRSASLNKAIELCIETLK